jgi:hypothetical protein
VRDQEGHEEEEVKGKNPDATPPAPGERLPELEAYLQRVFPKLWPGRVSYTHHWLGEQCEVMLSIRPTKDLGLTILIPIRGNDPHSLQQHLVEQMTDLTRGMQLNKKVS